MHGRRREAEPPGNDVDHGDEHKTTRVAEAVSGVGDVQIRRGLSEERGQQFPLYRTRCLPRGQPRTESESRRRTLTVMLLQGEAALSLRPVRPPIITSCTYPSFVRDR